MSLLLVQYSYLFSEEKQKEKEGQIYHICVVLLSPRDTVKAKE